MALRRNVTSLNAAERQEFVAALKKLKQTPSRFTPPTASRYDDYVYVHFQAMLVLEIKDKTKPVVNGNWKQKGMRMPMWAHRAPAFLAWHRELLHQFERDLQIVSGNPGLAIPYWDWSVDQTTTGLPWTSDLLGGDGHGDAVTTGPLAGKQNWPITLSEDEVDHLVRGFGRDPDAPRLPTPGEVEAAIAQAVYDQSPWNDGAGGTFRNQLEGWYVPPGATLQVGLHNLVHLWIGGTMLPSTSPNDPAFFLHHCNIDRLWAVWQQQHAGPHYAPGTSLPGWKGQGLHDPMIFYDPKLSTTPPWDAAPATPASVIDHSQLGYHYDTDQPAPAPVVLPPTALGGPVDEIVHAQRAIAPADHFRKRLTEL